MRHSKRRTLACLIGLMLPLAATAHHAIAMYDTASPMKLSGTVKTFDWGNPHSWLTVTAKNKSGADTDWLLECNSVALLERFGWTKTSLKPGDQITVIMAPHIDGIERGETIQVITADGKALRNAMVEP